MKLIKYILLLLILSQIPTLTSQVIRFNALDKSLGIQTAHKSKIHSHVEIQIKPYFGDIILNVVEIQLGYVWLLADRGAIRTGAQFIVWSLTPVISGSDPYYHYYNIVPLSVSVYPFKTKYLGIDLSTIFEPTNGTFNIKTTALIRF